MEKTLVVKYHWTLEEFVSAGTYFARANTTLRQRLSRWFLGLGSIAGIFYAILGPSEKIPNRIWGVFIFSVLAFFFLIYPIMRVRKALQKNYKASKTVDEEVSWVIKEETIVIEGPLASTEASWRVFEEAIFTPTGILLCPEAKSHLYWLPKRCFSEQDFDFLSDLVRRKIEKIKVLV